MRTVISIFFMVLVYYPILSAQYSPPERDNLNFYSLTEEEGLASNVVLDLIQDNKGFIWMATDNGLSRYDGRTFTNFIHDRKDSTSLPGNEIRCLRESSNGKIWIGTKQGVAQFHPESANFQRFPLPDSFPHGVNFLQINQILPGKNQELWLATLGWGLLRMDLNTHEIQRFPIQPKADNWNQNWAFNTINDMVFDLENPDLIWQATRNGLYLFDLKTRTHQPVPLKTPNNWKVKTSIFHDQTGELWISGWATGITRLDTRTGASKAFVPFPEMNRKLPGQRNIVHHIERKSLNELWVGISHAGLAIFHTEKETFDFIKKNSENRYSLLTDHVRSVWKTSGPTLWISHGDHGLSVLDRAKNNFDFKATSDPVGPNERTDFITTALHLPDKQELWISGHLTNGVYVYDEQLNWKRNIPTPLTGLPENQQFYADLVKDSLGNIWMLSGYQLMRLNPKEERFDFYSSDAFAKLPVPDVAITELFIDSRQHLWMGTVRTGLLQLKPDGQLIQHPLDSLGFKAFPKEELLGNICEDSSGNLWMTSVNGLYRFDPADRTFRLYPNNPTSRLFDGQIANLTVDENGELWIGLFEGGLVQFDPTTSKIIKVYDQTAGLPSDNVFSAFIAQDDLLWSGTAKGLISMDRKKELIQVYNRYDGLYPDYIGGRFYEMSNGRILLLQDEGFTHFQPSLFFEAGPPKIAFTQLKVFEKEWDAPVSIDYTDTLVFDHTQNFLTISFAALNHHLAGKNRYAWKLSKVDADWVYPTDNRQSATYSNLNPGTYRFQVKAANHEGIWNDKGRILVIRIKPPFWATWWFRSLIGLLIVGILSGLYSWRIGQVKKSERFKQQLAELELKALRAQINPHFIFNSLNSIKQLMQSDQKKPAISYLVRFSKLIREVLNVADKHLIPLSEELRLAEWFLQLEKLRFEDKFDYCIEIFPGIHTRQILIPPMIFQPYLENAIWHGLLHLDHKGNVELRIEPTENGIKCIIDDNGIGRKQAALLNSKSTVKHKSKGMSITQQRLSLQKDQYNIKVIDKDRGTRIEILIAKNS